jgi:rhamnogalacturonan endolyase
MAVSDERQRVMPSFEDRERGEPLDYPEAVLLTHPSDSLLRGEVLFFLYQFYTLFFLS